MTTPTKQTSVSAGIRDTVVGAFSLPNHHGGQIRTQVCVPSDGNDQHHVLCLSMSIINMSYHGNEKEAAHIAHRTSCWELELVWPEEQYHVMSVENCDACTVSIAWSPNKTSCGNSNIVPEASTASHLLPFHFHFYATVGVVRVFSIYLLDAPSLLTWCLSLHPHSAMDTAWKMQSLFPSLGSVYSRILRSRKRASR